MNQTLADAHFRNNWNFSAPLWSMGAVHIPLLNVCAETFPICNLQHYPTHFCSLQMHQLQKRKNIFVWLCCLLNTKWSDYMETSHCSQQTAAFVTHTGTEAWHQICLGIVPPPPPPPVVINIQAMFHWLTTFSGDSILSWDAVRECSKTAMLPGSDCYQTAGRLWKGKKENKKHNILQPAWQNVKNKGGLNSQRSYLDLFSSVVGVVGELLIRLTSRDKGNKNL